MGDSAIGEVVAGKYRIFRVLSVGGMGRLWLAHYELLGITVVVKRPGDWYDERQKTHRRFELEARAAASLSSRHIVKVLEFGSDERGPFLVMEYLEGRDLANVLDDEGPWAPGRVLGALLQIEIALHLAHRRGIVHRDLKPSNLFLCGQGDETIVKILDFGIAKAIGPDWKVGSGGSLTATGTLIGSHGYMSPEQSRGFAVDRRSDLWSLAAILYELLTGVSAFAASHPGDELVRVAEGRFTRISEVTTSLSTDFDEFFDKAFQVAPDNRFQDVRQLSAAFQKAVSLGNSSQLPITRSLANDKKARPPKDDEPPETLRFASPEPLPASEPGRRFGRAQATRTIVLDAPAPRRPSTAD